MFASWAESMSARAFQMCPYNFYFTVVRYTSFLMTLNFNNDITYALKALKNDGIILYPTDTVWGIGCDASNTNAIKKIYALKKREEKKSMIRIPAHYVHLKQRTIVFSCVQ